MDKHTTLRVVSAVADKKQAILYLEDGNTLILKQGDHRLGDLLDIIIPINAAGEVAVINLQDFSVYAAYEQKSKGMTKFFKMAKNKVSGWFGSKDEPTSKVSTITAEGQKSVLAAVMSEADVIEHGTTIDAADTVALDEVVVAVVSNPVSGKKTVIPGVQAIKPLLDHAVKTNSAVAVQAFLTRCAEFIHNRGHSVDDLMRFLERGDLPLAEDGSIIAYKMLKYSNNGTNKNIFVDCHSKNIHQRVGSYVCVNEKLVDLNRRNECASGLHIARRSYLGGFGGDLCVLCKIAPEDVMVVPHNDANKVRVKGYHILGVLSPAAMQALKKDLPMTGEYEAVSMVYNAIKGNHIGRIERVTVNGQHGKDVVTTPLKHGKNWGLASFSPTGEDLRIAAALDDPENLVGMVNPLEINKRVTEQAAISSQKVDDGYVTAQFADPDEEVDEEDQEEDVTFCSDCHVEIPSYEQRCPPCQERMDRNCEAEEMDKDNLITIIRFNSLDKMSAEGKVILIENGGSKAEKGRLLAVITENEITREILSPCDGVISMVFVGEGALLYYEDAIMAITANPPPEPKAEPKPKPKPKAKTKPKAKAKPKARPKAKTKPAPIPEEVIKAASGKVVKLTKAEEARALYVAGDMPALLAFKKKVKKGWSTLGITDKEVKKIGK